MYRVCQALYKGFTPAYMLGWVVYAESATVNAEFTVMNKVYSLLS